MLKVSNLSKTFKLYREPSDRLKEVFLRKTCHHEHMALSAIQFEVLEGETLGVIGPNGAGKSTLLKILTGVLLPDQGEVEVDGKITGLLELGTGFNLELSGLKNVYLNGMLLGMSREEVDRRVDQIVEFSELDDFIYEPMKTYSSGMLMRLGFSVAIHAEPRCFVVDEALSVGDAYFQQKCMDKIKAFRQQGGSIIFVSHDLNAVKILCDKTILLHRGKVVDQGTPEQVVNSYNFLLSQLGKQDYRTSIVNRVKHSYGTFDAEIKEITLVGCESQSDVVTSGEMVDLVVQFDAKKDMDEVSVGIMIRDKFGQDIFGTNTYHHQLPISVRRGVMTRCRFAFPMNISPGEYTITAALHTKDHHLEHCMHWTDQLKTFEVVGIQGKYFSGLCRLLPTIDVAFEGGL